MLIVCGWCYREVCYVVRLVLARCRVCYVLGGGGGCCVIMSVLSFIGLFYITYLLLLLLSLLLFWLLLLLFILLVLLLIPNPYSYSYFHHFLKGPDHNIHPTTPLFLKSFILLSSILGTISLLLLLILFLFPLLLTNHLVGTFQVTVPLFILMLVIFPLGYVLLYLQYLLLAGGASFCLLIWIVVLIMITFWAETTLV